MSSKNFLWGCLLLLLTASFLWTGCPQPDDPNIENQDTPGVPENVEATPGDTLVTLTWDPVEGATKYQVQYGPGDDFDNTSGELSETSYQANNLSNGQTYKFKVRAGNGEGVWSNYSAPVVATPVASQVPPSAPVISGVDNDTTGQLTVTWGSVSGASKYRYAYTTADLEPDTDNGSETQEFTATITGLENSTLYYVWVAAGNSAGWSAWTKASETTKAPLSYPDTIQATPGDTLITLTWDPVEGATKYQVQYGPGDAFDASSSELTATYFQAENLTNGQTYKFKVRAGDEGSWSGYSNAVQSAPVASVTPPSAPVISGVDEDTEGQLTVSWGTVTGASKYKYAYTTADVEPADGTETTELTAVITGLENSTLYYVWVAAGNSAGWSTWTKASGTTKTPVVYTDIKRIDFDKLSVFRETGTAPTGGARYDWQTGGGTQAADVTLSTEQDHTSGSGKSLKFSNRLQKYHRLKFEKIFSASDVGRTFNISMWVYADTATTVQLGVFSVGTGNTAATVNRDIPAGAWTRLSWSGYVHTDTTYTQLGFQQLDAPEVTLVSTFYIDDLEISATEISETTVKNIVFDDLSAFEMTANPPGDAGIKDWQGGGGTQAANVTLSTEQDHTTGSGKSLKFSSRTHQSYRIKFDGIFSAADAGAKFNAGMWVYTETATWIQLTVYRVSGPTYTSSKGGGDAIQRQFFRVEPGWNELVWRGYVHEGTENLEGTQLGIEQQGGESPVSTLYIDDILVTKVAE